MEMDDGCETRMEGLQSYWQKASKWRIDDDGAIAGLFTTLGTSFVGSAGERAGFFLIRNSKSGNQSIDIKVVFRSAK
jgi:hypothetical protein